MNVKTDHSGGVAIVRVGETRLMYPILSDFASAVSGLVAPQFLPTPFEVLERFVALTRTPFVGYTLQQHLASSFGRFAAGDGYTLPGVTLCALAS